MEHKEKGKKSSSLWKLIVFHTQPLDSYFSKVEDHFLHYHKSWVFQRERTSSSNDVSVVLLKDYIILTAVFLPFELILCTFF